MTIKMPIFQQHSINMVVLWLCECLVKERVERVISETGVCNKLCEGMKN